MRWSPAVLGAEQARAQAKKILAKVALDQDPQADRVARRGKDRISLRAVIDEYLADKEARVRRRTFIGVRRYLAGSYFKPPHRMPIDQIARRDVATRLATIEREHGPITAARCRGDDEHVFRVGDDARDLRCQPGDRHSRAGSRQVARAGALR
jgi:hypothetical protein